MQAQLLFTLLLASFSAPLAFAQGLAEQVIPPTTGGVIPGGTAPGDPNSDNAKEVASFCIRELNKNHNNLKKLVFGAHLKKVAFPLKVTKRKNFTQQVVSGVIYGIDLEVKDKHKKKHVVRAKVFVKPWLKWWKLLSMERVK